jgi:hypothetical protein
LREMDQSVPNPLKREGTTAATTTRHTILSSGYFVCPFDAHPAMPGLASWHRSEMISE